MIGSGRTGRIARRAAGAGLGLALVLLGAAPASSAAGGIERSREFLDGVHGAIDRGVVWLRSARSPGGGYTPYGGYTGATTALAYHTLRVCGVPADDPAAKEVWEALRTQYVQARRTDLQTYSTALFAMAVAEHGERLPRPDGERTTRLSPSDEQWMKELVSFLEAAQTQDGTWSYGSVVRRVRGDARAYDHSNTQYALLGLKAAARCGVPVRGTTWRKALDHFLSTQEKDGKRIARFGGSEGPKGSTKASAVAQDRARGWGYREGDGSYGSMTAGAVGSLVICRSELLGGQLLPSGLDRTVEQAVRDGLAWLGANYAVHTNPGTGSMAGPGWHYYYLYAVERAGILASVDWMADRDWYGEGAEYLVRAQQPRGFWVQGARGAIAGIETASDTVVTSCFALLFLKKGTLPVRRGALTQAADHSDIRFDAAASLSDHDFGDFLDLVLLRWRRSDDEETRRRLFDGTTSVGPRIVLPLLGRMEARDPDARFAAHALLRHATGLDYGFDPAAEPERREDSLAKWQGWWVREGSRLRYDGQSRRLASAVR